MALFRSGISVQPTSGRFDGKIRKTCLFPFYFINVFVARLGSTAGKFGGGRCIGRARERAREREREREREKRERERGLVI